MSSFGSEAFPKNSTQKAGSNENDWNEEEWGMDAPAAEAGMSTCTTPSLDLLGNAAELPTPVVKSRTAASRVEDLIVNQKQLHHLNQGTQHTQRGSLWKSTLGGSAIFLNTRPLPRAIIDGAIDTSGRQMLHCHNC